MPKEGKRMKQVTCNEVTRKCFANKDGVCTLLKANYPEGECPFCKPERHITDGKDYRKGVS